MAVVYFRTKSSLTKREARWVEFLADFDFTVVNYGLTFQWILLLGCPEQVRGMMQFTPFLIDSRNVFTSLKLIPTSTTIDAKGSADLYIQNIVRLHGLH